MRRKDKWSAARQLLRGINAAHGSSVCVKINGVLYDVGGGRIERMQSIFTYSREWAFYSLNEAANKRVLGLAAMRCCSTPRLKEMKRNSVLREVPTYLWEAREYNKHPLAKRLP